MSLVFTIAGLKAALKNTRLFGTIVMKETLGVASLLAAKSIIDKARPW